MFLINLLFFFIQVTGLYTPRKNSAGKRTTLNMASASGSTLYIVAVDERLEFLKKPKYISKDMVSMLVFEHIKKKENIYSWNQIHPKFKSNLSYLLIYSSQKSVRMKAFPPSYFIAQYCLL